MAEAVVDGLEVVQIDEEDRDCGAPGRITHRPVQAVQELRPVRKAGEAVMARFERLYLDGLLERCGSFRDLIFQVGRQGLVLHQGHALVYDEQHDEHHPVHQDEPGESCGVDRPRDSGSREGDGNSHERQERCSTAGTMGSWPISSRGEAGEPQQEKACSPAAVEHRSGRGIPGRRDVGERAVRDRDAHKPSADPSDRHAGACVRPSPGEQHDRGRDHVAHGVGEPQRL